MAYAAESMNIQVPIPVDGANAITVEVHLKRMPDDHDRNLIYRVFDAFERLAADGGMVYRFDRALFSEHVFHGTLTWRNSSFVYALTCFPYGERGMALLMRMLRRLVINGIHVDTVLIHGIPIELTDRSTICSVERALENLPEMRRDIPFQLKIRPSGAWVNLQCNLMVVSTNVVAEMLDSKIQNWASIVFFGGFHILTTNVHIEDEYGIGLSRPTVGEDFIEWHIQMPDVPPESLNCLVNILSHFSESFLPIDMVYIG